MMFPLPAPGSVAKPGPMAWDPQHPYRGLGFRTVKVNTVTREVTVTEYSIAAPGAQKTETGTSPTISVVAQRSRFTPSVIHLKKNVSTTLQISSVDTRHGFAVPDLNIGAAVVPGHPAVITVTADRTGEFDFLCDIFCGEGHENMVGRIIVE